MSTRIRRLKILQFDSLKSMPGLVHGFSTRHGGVSRAYGGGALNLGFTAQDSNAAVERNRNAFFHRLAAAKNGESWPLVTVRQIHSDLIHAVQGRPQQALSGDGLITDTPGLLLGILTADCIPVVLVDPRNRAVGVFHAGWRGTLKRIVQKGVGEMYRHYGTAAGDLRAAIGPGIHPCCYQVGSEVKEKFHSQFEYAEKLFRQTKESNAVREKYPLLFLTARAPGHSDLPAQIFLDLIEANRRQLLDSGVQAKRISLSPLCTSCHTELLFSHRREQGITGRMMAAVGIRP